MLAAAAALRARGLGVVRLGRGASRRPTILGRESLFVRYADPERAAVATFDFLDAFSASTSPEDTLNALPDK